MLRAYISTMLLEKEKKKEKINKTFNFLVPQLFVTRNNKIYPAY